MRWSKRLRLATMNQLGYTLAVKANTNFQIIRKNYQGNSYQQYKIC